MADQVTIFHNPRCSKSRETLALLEQHGLQLQVVRYLETPPDAETLRTLLRQLGLQPRALLRNKETEYLSLGLDDPSRSDDEIIQAMIAHPRLIERPIVVVGERAVLGRPPENVLQLL